jgi:hypothetical protein
MDKRFAIDNRIAIGAQAALGPPAWKFLAAAQTDGNFWLPFSSHA